MAEVYELNYVQYRRGHHDLSLAVPERKVYHFRADSTESAKEQAATFLGQGTLVIGSAVHPRSQYGELRSFPVLDKPTHKWAQQPSTT